MNVIIKYFPNLSIQQVAQFEALFPLYMDWNSKINVISRKDIENLYVHHVLHSLAIAKIIPFVDQTSVIDIGTGGGFPGIPLAILFPNVQFHLVDSIGKKIKLDLKIQPFSTIESKIKKKTVDFVVSRAVMPLGDLVRFCKKNIKKEQKNSLPNGLICLKGGELQSEIQAFKKSATIYELTDFFNEDYFKTKKAVYIPL